MKLPPAGLPCGGGLLRFLGVLHDTWILAPVPRHLARTLVSRRAKCRHSVMATLSESFVDLPTTRGAMRVHLFIPDSGGKHPGIIFYSEIFQVTGPIRRMAAALAGEGYLVAVPEVYHEFEPLGTVLAYDADGSARGNALKTEKEIASYEEDTAVVVKFLQSHESCTGRIASYGDTIRLVAEVPQAGLRPLAAPDPGDLPNNHLAYAGQWFFFALTALVIYVLALRRRGR